MNFWLAQDGSASVFPAKELVKKSRMGWIDTVRPSRRPLRGLLRMRNFLNVIKGFPHAEGAQRARLEARTTAMQPISFIFAMGTGRSLMGWMAPSRHRLCQSWVSTTNGRVPSMEHVTSIGVYRAK